MFVIPEKLFRSGTIAHNTQSVLKPGIFSVNSLTAAANKKYSSQDWKLQYMLALSLLQFITDF